MSLAFAVPSANVANVAKPEARELGRGISAVLLSVATNRGTQKK